MSGEAPRPIQFLRDYRDGLKLCDSAVKFISYTGRLFILLEFPVGAQLKTASKFRDIFWGLNAVRDLYTVPEWYREWKEKQQRATLANRLHIIAIRLNFLAKIFLRGANILAPHPLLGRAKSALGNVGLILVISMDAKSLVQAARGKEKVTGDEAMEMGDDFLDLINTSLDLELFPETPLSSGVYVATGLGSATLSIIRKSRIIWGPKAVSQPEQ